MATHPTSTRRVAASIGLLAAILVTACGGGYSNNDNSPPPLNDDASLADLTLLGATLDQLFQPTLLDYTAAAGFLESSVRVLAELSDPNASFEIDGVPAASGVAGEPLHLAAGSTEVTVTVTAEDGVTTNDYRIYITRANVTAFAQQAYIKASNAGVNDEFGNAVSLSDDTLAVAAVTEASGTTGVNGDAADDGSFGAGAAYVFVRDAVGGWSQQAYIKASNTGAFDEFGFSLALAGDTLAVGAPHEASAATGIDGEQTDNSAARAGSVYVFARDGSGTWSHQAYVKASNTDVADEFGYAVALSGDTLVVGAPGERGTATGVNGDDSDNGASQPAGAAYVFVRDASGTWTQQAYIKASNATGDDIVGGDVFGRAVALDGDLLAVGAPGEDSAATGVDGDQDNDDAQMSGAVYLFRRDADGNWAQEAYLKASNTGNDDWFGDAVAVSGNTVAVGAEDERSGATGIDGEQTDDSVGAAGAVYVFARDDAGQWAQQAYVKASNTGSDDSFGRSVALAGDSLAVGAWIESSTATGINGDETNDDLEGAGAVYVFTRDAADAWQQAAYVKASNTGFEDLFGGSVALADGTLAVGAYREDSSATVINGDQGNNNIGNFGAAYVFR